MTTPAASAAAETSRPRARRRPAAPKAPKTASSQLAASTKVLRSLLRITEALTSELEPEKAYDAILSVIRDVTGAEGVSLQLLKTPPEGTEPVLVLVETLGLPKDVPVGDVRSLDGSIAGWVIRHRKPLLLNGPTHSDPEVRRLMRQDEDLSAICVPLVNKGHPLGVLNARKDEEGDEGRFVPFSEQDLDFLAGQVAIALENARLFAQIAQQATVD